MSKDNAANTRIEQSARVDESVHGQRLDRAAACLFPEFSRARLQAWIKDGSLTIADRVARAKDAVAVGDELRLSALLESKTSWQAQAIPLEVLFEDEHLLVVNKPSGLVVHPGAGNPQDTLVNALLAHRESLSRLPRGGIVHRLDKDTTGLLVIAASSLAQKSLVEQLQKKQVTREYLAVVRGEPTGSGRVEAAIGRHPRQRTKMAVLEHGGKEAVTHYRLKRRLYGHALLSVRLETGRTHQIRVHMAHRGYPLVGDPVYGGRLRIPAGMGTVATSVLRSFKRQALHARALHFCHPASGQNLEFEAPIPPDLKTLIEALKEMPESA
ncbi:MAG: 23S rRNA pseudouridine(1911/1915/1917) synthase RluD [Pseudomonadota bacterium]